MKNEMTMTPILMNSEFNRCFKNEILKNTGLHITESNKNIQSPFIHTNLPPLWTLRGFRNQRSINSTVSSRINPVIICSITCKIPVFFTNIRKGIPVSARDSVFFPPEFTKKLGTIKISNDGFTLFSKRIYRGWSKKRILKKQLEDILLLESIIDLYKS